MDFMRSRLRQSVRDKGRPELTCLEEPTPEQTEVHKSADDFKTANGRGRTDAYWYPKVQTPAFTNNAMLASRGKAVKGRMTTRIEKENDSKTRSAGTFSVETVGHGD